MTSLSLSSARPASAEADVATSPCLACGLCCSHFRVSFYWGEGDDVPGGWVPSDLTEPLPPLRRCMRGTHSKTPRCVALSGTPGASVACTIYPYRPTPCREFDTHEADGSPNPRCNDLRSRFGLPPLAAR